MPPMLDSGVEYASVIVTLMVIAAVLILACGPPDRRSRFLSGDGNYHFDKLRTEHLTHNTRGWSPLRFGLLRFAFGCFAVGTSAWRVLRNGYFKPDWLTTFTAWSWCLLGVYFLLVGLLSLRKGLASEDASAADNRTGSFHHFLWVWCQIMTVMALFICLICWIVLIPLTMVLEGWDITRRDYFGFVNLNAHNTNVIFMMAEVYLNRMTFLRAHAPFIAFYGLVYIVFSWFYYWETGRFWYIFVNWNAIGYFTPVAYVALLAVLYCTFLGVARCSVSLKKGVPPKEFPTEEGAPEGSEQDQELPAAAAS